MGNTFGERLRYALKYRGMKQSELASKLNVGRSLITMYIQEYCKPKADNLFVIADLLEVNPRWLIGYDVPMFEEK